MEDPQQVTLMELCAKGIGVYSPHTSVDGAVGGMNDWLATVATGGLDAAIEPIIPVSVEGRIFSRNELMEGHEDGGSGRICTLLERTVISHVCKRVKSGLGVKYGTLGLFSQLIAVRVARSPIGNASVGIRTIAVCAGSGSSVFKALPKRVDVIVTGELSHHEVLSYVESGTSVILCGHTNTERGYLPTLQRKLAENIAGEYGESRVEVIVSKADKDPLDLFNQRD